MPSLFNTYLINDSTLENFDNNLNREDPIIMATWNRQGNENIVLRLEQGSNWLKRMILMKNALLKASEIQL